MKKLAVLFIIVVSLAMAPQQVFAGENGIEILVRVLGGDFNGDGYHGGQPQGQYRISHIPPPRLMPPTGNAARWACSPRDRAYYQAKDRIYRQEYNRWVREQAQIGRAEGELEALRNVQQNRNRFFTRY